jgi:hypothetical protein
LPRRSLAVPSQTAASLQGQLAIAQRWHPDQVPALRRRYEAGRAAEMIRGYLATKPRSSKADLRRLAAILLDECDAA